MEKQEKLGTFIPGIKLKPTAGGRVTMELKSMDHFQMYLCLTVACIIQDVNDC